MLSLTHLQLALGIKEQVLRFNIPMCDALAVQVLETQQNLKERREQRTNGEALSDQERHKAEPRMGWSTANLLEGTFDLGRAHTATLDGSVQVTTGTILHDLAPVLMLVLDQVDSFNDVWMMQCGADAELGSEFLDVLSVGFVLALFAELLARGGRMKRMNGKRKEGWVVLP